MMVNQPLDKERSFLFEGKYHVAELFVDVRTIQDEESSVKGEGRRGLLGLKHLTLRVKEIVERHRGMSYKEVAEELVRELDRENKLEKSKDEQNIKRRVYDALNVLIAAKKLRKEGKRVIAAAPSQAALSGEELERLVVSARAVVTARAKELSRLRALEQQLLKLTARNREQDCGARLALPVQGVVAQQPRVERGEGWLLLCCRRKPRVLPEMELLRVAEERGLLQL